MHFDSSDYMVRPSFWYSALLLSLKSILCSIFCSFFVYSCFIVCSMCHEDMATELFKAFYHYAVLCGGDQLEVRFLCTCFHTLALGTVACISLHKSLIIVSALPHPLFLGSCLSLFPSYGAIPEACPLSYPCGWQILSENSERISYHTCSCPRSPLPRAAICLFLHPVLRFDALSYYHNSVRNFTDNITDPRLCRN